MSALTRCRLCGSERNVIDHHLSYFPEKIMEVCRRCHWSIHKINSSFPNLLPPRGDYKKFMEEQRKAYYEQRQINKTVIET